MLTNLLSIHPNIFSMNYYQTKKTNLNYKDNVLILIRLFLLSVIFLMPYSLNAQGKKISISVKNVSLQQLFTEIENRSDIRFSYKDNNLDPQKDITITVKESQEIGRAHV